MEFIKYFGLNWGAVFVQLAFRSFYWLNWSPLEEFAGIWPWTSMEQSQEIPRILWNTALHNCIHKCRTAAPTLSQSNPIHASLFHFLKVYFNSIFPFTRRFSKCSLSLSSLHENLVYTSPISHTYHMPHPSHSLWFSHPNNNDVPDLKSHFHCLCCTKGSVEIRGLIKCSVTSFLRLGVVSTSPNSRLGRPPLVGRPKLLFIIWAATVHIFSPVRLSTTWGRAMLWWPGHIYGGM